MKVNWFNIGNNIPPGFDDKGELQCIGLSGKYHGNIADWEKANEAELQELKACILTSNKSIHYVFDKEFCNRFDKLKDKFPKHYIYISEKHFKKS